MIGRLAPFALALAVAVDQLLGVMIIGTLYLVGLADLPNPDETISSYVGRAVIVGKWWAPFVAAVIDWLFLQLGDPDHCRNSIEWDEVERLCAGGSILRKNDDEL